MKKILYYVFVAFAAASVASCGHTHSHDHEHDHAHNHEHETEHTQEVNSHSHNHEEHSHAEPSHKEHSHSHPEGCITFGKEQQSKIDFEVTEVKGSNFNGAVKVAARVVAAPDNLTTVVAAVAGRLRYAGNIVEGKELRQGDALFIIEGGNVTENDAAVKFARAESDYNLARADYERKVALHKENVVSQKELQTAEAALQSAEAHYNSMKRSFSNGKTVLAAPMSGYISSLLADNGAYVQAGTPLACVQRDGEVNIEAELPVRFASQLAEISGVNIELATGAVLSLDEVQGTIVGLGRSANSCNMIPVTVSAKKLAGVVPGSIVTLHLASLLPQGAVCPVVPRSALIEEMGNYFVFVQHCSDAFEKREVKIGSTDGMYTQILKGLKSGERVVSQGAVSLKLSQAAGALDPHAGHVH